MFIHVIDMHNIPEALFEGFVGTIDPNKTNVCRLDNTLVVLAKEEMSSVLAKTFNAHTTIIESKNEEGLPEIYRTFHRYIGIEPDESTKADVNDLKNRIQKPFARFHGRPEALVDKDCDDLVAYFNNLIKPWRTADTTKETILTWYPNEGQSVVYNNIEKVNHRKNGADITFKNGKGLSLMGGSYSIR